jgi:hypothetical protein
MNWLTGTNSLRDDPEIKLSAATPIVFSLEHRTRQKMLNATFRRFQTLRGPNSSIRTKFGA